MNVPPEQYLLASAFGGAVVTAVIALITLIANARQAHKRWILDLKFEAYYEYLLAAHLFEMRSRLRLELFPNYKGEEPPRDARDAIKVTMLASTPELRKAIVEYGDTKSRLGDFVNEQEQKWRAIRKKDPTFTPDIGCDELVKCRELGRECVEKSSEVVVAVRKELHLGGDTPPIARLIYDLRQRRRSRKSKSALATNMEKLGSKKGHRH